MRKKINGMLFGFHLSLGLISLIQFLRANQVTDQIITATLIIINFSFTFGTLFSGD
jgi:hypothetical protein